jgi:hypothetical protein
LHTFKNRYRKEGDAEIVESPLIELAAGGKERDIGTTGESVVHGGEQVRIHKKLQNVPETTGLEATGNNGRVLKSGEEDNPGFGRAALKFASDFNATQAWHGNVQDSEVRIEFDDGGEGVRAIGDESDNVERGAQQSVCGVQNMSKVIGDEDTS